MKKYTILDESNKLVTLNEEQFKEHCKKQMPQPVAEEPIQYRMTKRLKAEEKKAKK